MFNELTVSGSARNGGRVPASLRQVLRTSSDCRIRWMLRAGQESMTRVLPAATIYETKNTQAAPFTYVILDNNATKIQGKHEFQFGFHYRYDQLNALPEQQQNQGNHNFATQGTSLYDSATSRNNPAPHAVHGA